MGKAKPTCGAASSGCDQRDRRGVCLAIVAAAGVVERCPAERAQVLEPGDCCHHPDARRLEQLRELRAAGVPLAEDDRRARDPAWVERLWRAWRARRVRAT